MKIRLNISPCPNDTFMFDALLNGRVDTEGLEFDARFADIEELNRSLLGDGAPQVSKASYAIVGKIADRFDILSSGSALGKGNGPLWVSGGADADITDYSMRVAVPGEHTTANLLMNVLYPHMARKSAVLFSEIADAVVKGQFDSGVLIHEGRFTYRSKGLSLISDLGLEWERTTGLPLPLGAIVVSKELSEDVKQTINRVLRRSVRFALDNPEASREFVFAHAQEMDPDVMRKHIELFVNDYSVSLGENGKNAVRRLLGNKGEALVFVEDRPTTSF